MSFTCNDNGASLVGGVLFRYTVADLLRASSKAILLDSAACAVTG